MANMEETYTTAFTAVSQTSGTTAHEALTHPYHASKSQPDTAAHSASRSFTAIPGGPSTGINDSGTMGAVSATAAASETDAAPSAAFTTGSAGAASAAAEGTSRVPYAGNHAQASSCEQPLPQYYSQSTTASGAPVHPYNLENAAASQVQHSPKAKTKGKLIALTCALSLTCGLFGGAISSSIVNFASQSSSGQGTSMQQGGQGGPGSNDGMGGMDGSSDSSGMSGSTANGQSAPSQGSSSNSAGSGSSSASGSMGNSSNSAGSGGQGNSSNSSSAGSGSGSSSNSQSMQGTQTGSELGSSDSTTVSAQPSQLESSVSA